MGNKNPKAKGSNFERKVCQRLSLWVSNRTREDIFWRSAMSGGRTTMRTRKARGPQHLAHAGDITATHELGHLLLRFFLIECKFHKDLYWERVVYGVPGGLPQIWKGERKKAKALGNRRAMVVAKMNFKEEVILVDADGKRWLMEGLRAGKSLQTLAYFPAHRMIVLRMRDVLAHVDFEVVRRLWMLRAAVSDEDPGWASVAS